MNTLKMSSLQKLTSFILIAVLLVCTVGFAANGWQSPQEDDPDSDKVGDQTDNVDENIDGNSPPQQDPTDTSGDDIQKNPQDNEVTPAPSLPVYINPITGLEISAEQSTQTPIGFVLDPKAPLYGVSGSDLALEFRGSRI